MAAPQELILTRKVFGLLVSALDQKLEIPTVGGVRSKYGFGDKSYQENKQSLRMRILEEPNIQKEWYSRYKNNEINIDGKYIYNRIREYNNKENFIILTKQYAWIYFTFLGLTINSFLKQLVTKGVLTIKEEQDQLDILENHETDTPYHVYTFELYHYSVIYDSKIFGIDLQVERKQLFTGGNDKTISVKAQSKFIGEGSSSIKAIKYEGSLVIKQNSIVIDLTGIKSNETILPNSYHIILAYPSSRIFLFNDSGVIVLKGSYVGTSRDSSIISGEVFLVNQLRINPNNNEYHNLHRLRTKSIENLTRYILLTKGQHSTRINIGYFLHPEVYAYKELFLTRSQDELGVIEDYIGSYQFCWLSRTNNALIIIKLEITQSFNCIIHSLPQYGGIYTAYLSSCEKTLCLNFIHKDLDPDTIEGKFGRYIVSSAYFNRQKNYTLSNDQAVIPGLFVLALTRPRPNKSRPYTNPCLLVEKKNVTPMRYEKDEILDDEFKRIYEKLAELREEESSHYLSPLERK